MHYLTEPHTGLFLCTESDEAFLSPAFFELGSNPVKATSHPASIVGVFVTVESFEQKHPLISAEMNGFRRRWVSHEWSLAVSVNGLYCSTGVKGINLAPPHHLIINGQNHNTRFHAEWKAFSRSQARLDHCFRLIS